MFNNHKFQNPHNELVSKIKYFGFGAYLLFYFLLFGNSFKNNCSQKSVISSRNCLSRISETKQSPFSHHLIVQKKFAVTNIKNCNI